MSERKKQTPIEEKLTLAQARARISEFAGMKKVEGKGGGAAIPPKRGRHRGGDEDNEESPKAKH